MSPRLAVPNIGKRKDVKQNTSLLTALKVELNSQVNILSDSNLEEMQEEISIIKEWTDEQVGVSNTETPNNNGNTNNMDNDSNINTNDEQQNSYINNQGASTYQTQNTVQEPTSLPYTGANSIMTIIIILLSISIIISIIRYKQFKDVK